MTPEAQTTILTFTFCTLAIIGVYSIAVAIFLFCWHNLISKPMPKVQTCTREHKCSIDGPCNGYPRWVFIHLKSDVEFVAKVAAHRKEMGI